MLPVGEAQGCKNPNRRSKGSPKAQVADKMPVGQEGVNAPNKIMRAQGADGSAINGSSRAQGTSKSANRELGCEDTSLWDTRVQQSTDCEGRMLPIEMPMRHQGVRSPMINGS